MTASSNETAFIQATLAHWKEDPDLVSIRDAPELAKLPEVERKQWQRLWSEIETLLRRIPAPAPAH
jgi:hypothetical protein